jgi:hypothetical protein
MNKTTTTPEDLKRAFASIGLIYKGSQFGQYEWRTSDGKRGLVADWNGREWCMFQVNPITGIVGGAIASPEHAARIF